VTARGRCLERMEAGENTSFATRHPREGADLFLRSVTASDLQEADLGGVDLRGADLTAARLEGANLISANLSGANLYIARANRANFWTANLTGADLSYGFLSMANFNAATLRGANLTGSQLGGAIVRSAKLATCRALCGGRHFRLIFLCFRRRANSRKVTRYSPGSVKSSHFFVLRNAGGLHCLNIMGRITVCPPASAF
jgi:hypothetical protein